MDYEEMIWELMRDGLSRQDAESELQAEHEAAWKSCTNEQQNEILKMFLGLADFTMA